MIIAWASHHITLVGWIFLAIAVGGFISAVWRAFGFMDFKGAMVGILGGLIFGFAGLDVLDRSLWFLLMVAFVGVVLGSTSILWYVGVQEIKIYVKRGLRL